MRAFVFGFVVWGLLFTQCASLLEAAEPLKFATKREAEYWDALVSCRAELDDRTIELAGERSKVKTASVAIHLACPPIPACPAVESQSCLLPGVLGVAGGALLGGLFCAFNGPDVAVIR